MSRILILPRVFARHWRPTDVQALATGVQRIYAERAVWSARWGGIAHETERRLGPKVLASTLTRIYDDCRVR